MNQDRAKSAIVKKDRTITQNLKDSLDKGGDINSNIEQEDRIGNRPLIASEEHKENKINFINDQTINYDGDSNLNHSQDESLVNLVYEKEQKKNKQTGSFLPDIH